jgi:hypothetical protein
MKLPHGKRVLSTACRIANLASVLAPLLLAGAAVLVLLLNWGSVSTPAHAGQNVSGLPSTQLESDRSALRRMTDDGRSIPWAWTPDGQSLLVKRPGRGVSGQQLFELWLVSLGDGGERLLAENAVQPAVEDGRVAYLRYLERERWEAVEAELTGGGRRSLGDAQWVVPPSWIEGSLVYVGPTGQWVNHAEADRRSSLPDISERYTRARLSPDGRSVAATDGRRLWVLGMGESLLVALADQIGGFAWSPGAARLAYVRSDGGPLPELWVWDTEAGRSWMLAQGELEHFGAPAWSPDGRTLAFVRQPTGSGPNAAGDIWLVQVDEVGAGDKLRSGDTPHLGGRLRPLAQTPVDEGSPRWSPDGRRLAFSLEGDTWVAALDAPGLRAEMSAAAKGMALDTSRLEEPAPTAPVAPLGLTAPLTIWVLHDAARNTCRDVPDGQIDALPFEQYVKQVVPNEVPALWPMEVVKAQAVAARTYGWRKALDRPYPLYLYTVKDSTADQYMCDRTHSRSDAAVDDTQGQYVGYDGRVTYTFYCAEAGDPTNYQMLFPGVAYLRSVSDPVSFGQVRRGHSWGMSQWGAYRWAVRHGWDYQQILGHYYTSAGVEPSAAVTQPLAALMLPWSDHYVGTDRAALRAHATRSTSVAGSGVLTVTFVARLTDTWTLLHTDASAGDGWGYVWPVGSLSDTVTPSIGLKAMAYDGAGQVVESGITLIGLNRGAPTGTLGILTSTDLTTLTVPLSLAVTDPSPDRGPLRVSLVNGDWVWEEDALSWTGGELVDDPVAGNGRAWRVGAGVAGTLSGLGTGRLPSGQPYRAYFSLRASAEALTADAELARLAVLVDAGSGAELLGVRYVRGTDLKAADVYQEFAVDFAEVPGSGELGWRVDSYGKSDLWVDRISVAGYPVDVAPTVTWTLSPREGPATISARFLDGAGNPSPAASLAVTVTDRGPPDGWHEFRCSGLTCTVRARDAIAGLDTGSAAVRLSGDGGQSWGDWLPAACSGEDGSHDWETLEAAVGGVTSAVGTRQIQFRIYDRAVLPNKGRSPIYVRAWAYLPVVIRSTR